MGAMKPPHRILVVVTRRIGDVLLTTPLIRALKRAWPAAAVDVLVFTGTAGVLSANPDVSHVLTIAERPRWHEHLSLLTKIARRYDLSLSVVPSDRPTLYAWLASRHSVGLVAGQAKHRWKKWLLQQWMPFDNIDTHTVLMHLALADVLAIAPCYEVTAAWTEADAREVARQLPFALGESFAVLHVYPRFNYKMWRPEAWIETAQWLQARSMRVVFTGGGDIAEYAYVDAIARAVPGAVNVAGKLSLAQTACLLKHARTYVGPDTAATHMAAALGVPVIALYGPGNPVKWGPWPHGYARAQNPWRRLGAQRVNNVTLLQPSTPACVPCFNEGCDRHVASYSDCLQHFPAARITAALEAASNG